MILVLFISNIQTSVQRYLDSKEKKSNSELKKKKKLSMASVAFLEPKRNTVTLKACKVLHWELHL